MVSAAEDALTDGRFRAAPNVEIVERLEEQNLALAELVGRELWGSLRN